MFSLNNIIYFLIISYISLIIFQLYRDIWLKYHSSTPKGCGVLLPVFIYISHYIFKADLTLITIPIILITLTSIIYWIDDFLQLSPVFRLIIASSSGALIFAFCNHIDYNKQPFVYIGCCLFFSIICVGLTNALNFYDGNDLNIACLIFISGLILLINQNELYSTFKYLGPNLMGISIGFGLINKKPLSLYWGDSGSYALAAIFTLLFVLYFSNEIQIPIEVFIPLSLPIFDVFYVILIRIYKKHNLLTRNYLHLYQRLFIRFGNPFHLLPQIFHSIIVIIFSEMFIFIGLSKILSIILSTLFITPTLYIIIRRVYVEPGYFFGDGVNE